MQNSQKIPEGWSVKKLGECFSFLKTPSYSRAETTSDGEVHYIHYGDIHTKYSVHVSPEDIDIFVSNEQAQKGDFLRTGDLILLDASEDYDGTTKCVELTAIKDSDKVISGLHTLALRDNSNNFVNGFRAYITSMPFVKNNFWKQVTGIKVYGVSKDNLKKLKLLLPPLAEQKKIARILGTWDEAIEKLSNLIEQKKLLKKGLMQKLLTDKHRLKGFSTPWHEVKLGDIGTTYTGLSGKDKESFGHGKPYIPYLNIYQNFVIDTNQFELVAIKDGENQNTVKYGDIFFTTSSETPDEVGISSVLLEEPKEETYLNSFCFGFRLHDFSILLPFYAAYLCRSEQIRKTMYMLAQGATRFNLSKTEFLKSYIYIPSDLAEQKAIAEILSKADEEIELLNKKLEAFKQEKKALMQQLLTGKIRVKVN